jgi:hypothetical protein
MRIVDTEELQWHSGPGHREPGVFLRDVLTGPEGGPGNFWFTLVRVEDRYDTPRHSHNFEQVRVMLEGDFNFGDQDQVEGTIGYFSEGTSYEQHARGKSLTLLLQCEGGSGSRYLSQAEMRRAVVELRARGGDFADGIYRGPDPLGEDIVSKDSVEAIWEHIVGERATYPACRYEKPVIMRPQAFAFRRVAGNPGVAEKLLGTFGERRLTLSLWRLDPDATRHFDAAVEGRSLFFVLHGTALLEGDPLPWRAAAEILADERGNFTAGAEGAEILVMRLPD